MEKQASAKLLLEDGTLVAGKSFGFEVSVSGEVVFNTAMTGYPESLTDPSYAGQILVATYPLMGNYGIPAKTASNGLLDCFESERVQIAALIVSDYSMEYSHWDAHESLGSWLRMNRVPGLYGIDTRALVKIIRDKGTMLGKIVFGNDDPGFNEPNSRNLVGEVSTGGIVTYGTGRTRILLVDCGVKYSIIRNLLRRDTTVIRVPWDYDYSNEKYDGLVISNGPGDPKICRATIRHLAKSLRQDVPMLGICLGNQLLALAAGADTYKLKYGHRSHNQPVLELGTNRAFITSQNHGYAIDTRSLPPDWEPFFVNLNDGTNEGIKHRKRSILSVQFHPEASGGPTDSEYLFDDFLKIIWGR